MTRWKRIPIFRSFCALLAACWCAACATRAAEPPLAWRSPHGRDHALAGRILDVAAQRPIAEAQLFDRLARADVVVLGEKHDNPDHHAIQARVVDALVVRGRRPALAFEMLDEDDAAPLARARRDAPGDAEAIRRAVGWDASGWPAWSLYAPLFERAVAAELPVVAANLAPGALRAVSRGGVGALDAGRIARLALAPEAAAHERAVLADAVRASHCGMAGEARIDRMVDVQRVWNAQLGSAALGAARAAPDGAAVLVAGNEHARRDVGEPAAIARIDPSVRVVAVALLEVDPRRPDADPAAAYGAQPPFDYVWTTPRVDLADPCEQYREALEQMRAPQPE
ncbi:MAG: hypothetical protein DCC71_08495 [Proteobacteria bacterium]|nr:MAG: hypothetical protein DCC71_08495 [Pseudomonadota bacterium]